MEIFKDNMGIFMLIILLFGISVLTMIQTKRLSESNAELRVVVLEHQKALVEHANVIRSLLSKK